MPMWQGFSPTVTSTSLVLVYLRRLTTLPAASRATKCTPYWSKSSPILAALISALLRDELLGDYKG